MNKRSVYFILGIFVFLLILTLSYKSEDATSVSLLDVLSSQERIVCNYNYYDCSDFVLHSDAKSIYDFCGGVKRDIHFLDWDKDEIPCEGLLS